MTNTEQLEHFKNLIDKLINTEIILSTENMYEQYHIRSLETYERQHDEAYDARQALLSAIENLINKSTGE